MGEADFEISAGLRARELVIHVVPEADIAEDGVTPTRREARSGLAKPPERGRRYTDVDIEKQTIATTERTALQDNQPRSGGVEDYG